ncbi:MAG: beta-galactosidase, partial [Clostridia bacterium]|nr:beta-galactosidase [Clostridia bacterium]
VKYTEYNVGTLTVNSNSAPGAGTAVNNSLYLIKQNGSTVDDWTHYTYVSGAGFKVNGETATLNAIQNVGSGLYLAFEGVSEGDVISIEGTYVCDTTAIRYVIPESKFIWTGSGWEIYVEYTIHNLGALELHNNSAGCGANVLYLQKAGGTALPVLDWDHVFTYESGDGWKVNGVATTLNTFKSTPDGLYLDFGAVPTDAVVSISGTFVYSQAPVKYVIDESKFVWNGSSWEKYVEYTEYNVGMLTVNPNSAPGANTAVNTSLYLIKQNGSTVDDWTHYTYVSGAGFKVNGETATLNAIQNVGSGLYLAFSGVKEGDVISISGTYKCAITAIKYVIDEALFMWNGSGWVKCYAEYADSQLAAYDVVGISDLGLGLNKEVKGVYDGSLLTYTQSAGNTTGSVKFRFQVNSVDTTNGATAIRLRGSAWSGVRFEITEGVIRTWNEAANSQRLPLSNNTDYMVELGAIDLLNSDYIWAYIKLDGVVMASELLLKTEISDTDGAAYGTYNTNAVSLYVDTTGITFTDPDHVSVTYTSLYGSRVEYVAKNSDCTVSSEKAKTYNTFIGWVVNDTLYQAGDVIEIGEENITLTALEIEFRMEEGAAIRVAGTADESGIRFTTLLKETDLNTLKGYIGEGSVSYGTLIIAYDYLVAGQEPNLKDFTPGENIIKLPTTYSEVNADGFIVYRGAMQKLYEENHGRLFAGRGYIEITVNDKTITVYTPFDKADNVRSIRQVAQAFQADTSEPAEGEIRYATLSEARKAIVDAYAALNEIELMNYASYAANNFLNVIAWNYPALDESNEYNNDKNIAIATQMKNTGIKVVNLTGENLLVLNTKEAIEKTHQIIKFFWSQGLKTVAFAANNVENFNTDFTQIGTPDFSDCEGFIGFLHWDEPTEDDTTMSKLADLAIQFNDVYAGSDVTYMNNLLPSYAPYFQTTETNWWGGSSTTLDKEAFKAYVKEYCDKVLSQVKGEKWLSIDSYPINKNYSLHDTFLLDLGVIKYYAMEYGAHAHVALQSSGFGTNDNDTKARIPTEAEMRMQAYAALAFGMDSISWFTYSPSASGSETFYTFVDNDGNIIDQTAYDAFTKVNKELAAIGAVYSAFEWQGIILGAGKDNSNWIVDDTDYIAFETASGQIGEYELSVNDTKHLSSVATNQTNWNYLMSVMQDANGNEGYVLCNYNACGSDTTQTITLAFNKNITEVVIYRGGVAQTVSVTNNTLAIELATGEGVIVLPSKLG